MRTPLGIETRREYQSYRRRTRTWDNPCGISLAGCLYGCISMAAHLNGIVLMGSSMLNCSARVQDPRTLGPPCGTGKKRTTTKGRALSSFQSSCQQGPSPLERFERSCCPAHTPDRLHHHVSKGGPPGRHSKACEVRGRCSDWRQRPHQILTKFIGFAVTSRT